MDLNQIASRLVVGTLLVVGTPCIAGPQDTSAKTTATPRSELLEWFSGPSAIDDVISSSSKRSFLKSTAFGSQGQTQDPNPPTPPTPPGATGQDAVPPSVASPTPYPVQPVQPPAIETAPEAVELPLAIIPPVAGKSEPQVPANPSEPNPAPSATSPGLLGQTNAVSPTQSPLANGCQTGTCATGGCQSVACGSCRPSSCYKPTLCDQPCSGWTGSIGALFLTRNNPNRLPMFVDTTTPANRMDASNFDFGMQTGIEASLTRHRAIGNWDYELRYFGIDDWDSLQSQRFDGSPIQIGNTPPTFISGPRRAVSRYASELHNFEWNLKRQINSSTRFVFGFRNIQLNEQLATRFRSLAVPAISTEDYTVNTKNRLYGLQVGFDRTLLGDACYCLEAYGRAGAFANDSRQRSALINYLDTTRTFANRDRDTGFSFVNEVGLRARYQIFDCANFFAGYRGLWVNDVALASDQIPHTNFAGGSNLDNSGRAFFHGGTIGLEVRF